MPIPCPGCEREYETALFEYGRTLWCACGARVGAERSPRPIGSGGEVRFFADAMLGRLARWLRLLGFDCAWEIDIPDGDLVRRAIESERIILTRDRALPHEWRVSDIHVFRSESTSEQLTELIERYDLAGRVRLFGRCSRCNDPIEPASKEEAARRVPARVLTEQDTFWKCPGCGRLYWQGSHTERIKRVAEQLLAPR